MAHILVVDDNADNRELLSLILEVRGHSVLTADNGREALQEVTRKIPDVVHLNVEMPVLSGPEMAFELFLRDCGEEKVPIVLLSGRVGLPEVAAQVGTPYFLGKPYSPEALFGTLARALQEKIAPEPKACPS